MTNPRSTLWQRLRPVVVGFVFAVALLGATGCFTASDLRFYGPEKPFHYVCDKPLGLSDDAKLWALDETTDRIWSDDNILELRLHASQATAFYQYESTAPESSVTSMPANYGLKCAVRAKIWPDARPVLPSSEELRDKERGLVEVDEKVGRPDPHWFAAPGQGKRARNPPAQAMKQPQALVRVCARPKGVGKDVGKWTSRDVKGNLLTNSEKVFADAVAKAEILFIYDETAPPESVYWFVKDPAELSCPNKPPPQPYNQAKVSGRLGMMAAVTSIKVENTVDPKTFEKQMSWTPSPGGQMTWTSDPNGNGPPLNALETVVRQLMFAGALASGDTSGNAKDPNGARYGATNGKNVDGPNSLAVQAVAGTIALIGVPLKSPRAFIDAVRDGLRKGKAAFIRDPEFFSKDVAKKRAAEPTEEELKAALTAIKEGKEVALESFGKAMAPALQEAKTIMPYSRAQIFTEGWEGKFQAHHIFEEFWMKELGKGSAKDAPAIVLTKAEHDAITQELNKAKAELVSSLKKTGKPLEPADVWQMYQEVYKKYPNWLEAIAHYFK